MDALTEALIAGAITFAVMTTITFVFWKRILNWIWPDPPEQSQEPSMTENIVHPILWAIIRPIDEEPQRWRASDETRARRDDHLMVSAKGSSVTVWEDFLNRGDHYLTIKGQKSIEAVSNALRLLAIKTGAVRPTNIEIKSMIERKLGINSVD